MNEGVPINLEHWIQIITTIPEILQKSWKLSIESAGDIQLKFGFLISV
jgi:hypothetical protein